MLEFVNVVFELCIPFDLKKIGTFGNEFVDSGPKL